MEIKSSETGGSIFWSISAFVKAIRKRTMILCLLIGILSGGFCTLYILYSLYTHGVFYMGRTGFSLGKIVPLVRSNYRIPINYMKSYLSTPDSMTLDVNHRNFQKIEYTRRLALKRNTLYGLDNSYVDAKVRYNGDTIPVKIRLKGGMADHMEPNKFSLRIKVKQNKTLLGMKNFSLMNPRRRAFLFQWFLREIMRKEGVISKRYGFVALNINGHEKGIYAYDEHFNKVMLEYNKRKEGPIIRFNSAPLFYEEVAWHNRPSLNDDYYFAFDIGTFRIDKVVEEKGKLSMFNKARHLLEGFRQGDLKTHEVFDIGLMAKWAAIADITGAWHGFSFNNLHFYYNPITSRLEPIPDDSFNELSIWPGQKVFRINDQYNKGRFLKDLFNDYIFVEQYIKEIERVTTKEYMDAMLDEFSEGIDHNLRILYREDPYYIFNTDPLYHNQREIRTILNPHKGVQAYMERLDRNGLEIVAASNKTLPMEILDVRYKDTYILKPRTEKTGGRVIIKGKDYANPVKYESLGFELPERLDWNTIVKKNLKIRFRVLGSSEIREEPIFLYESYKDTYIRGDSIRMKPNFRSFENLQINENVKEILFSEGLWTIDRDLIIPAGYTVRAGAGATIDLVKSAMILTYSTVAFIGTEDNPVIVTSSDKTGRGFTIIGGNTRTILRNVQFSKLSTPSEDGWGLTGAVNVYETPIYIKDVSFRNNLLGDDFLNIIRSDFIIDGALFEETSADALDVDFSKGKLINTAVLNCGTRDGNGDGIDFSGSIVEVKDTLIDGGGDKGISIGERSDINLTNLVIRRTNIGIACKDLSNAVINNVKIEDTNIAFAVFQKKPEYGPASIFGQKITLTKVTEPYLVESGSTLRIDGKTIKPNRKNLKKLLYPSRSRLKEQMRN